MNKQRDIFVARYKRNRRFWFQVKWGNFALSISLNTAVKPGQNAQGSYSRTLKSKLLADLERRHIRIQSTTKLVLSLSFLFLCYLWPKIKASPMLGMDTRQGQRKALQFCLEGQERDLLRLREKQRKSPEGNHNSKRYMHLNVHCSTVYSSQDMETIQMSTDRGIDNERGTCIQWNITPP